MTPLKKELDRIGMTPTTAAKKTGLPQPVIQRWYSGTRPITKAGAMVLGPLVQRAPEYLMFSDRTVRIVGKVGAANELNYFSESSDLIGLARFPDHGTEDTVAVEIDGNSLGSAWDGWIAYFDDRKDPPTPNMIGQLCIVGLRNGAVLAKRLMRGRQVGLYDLWPGSGMGDPMPDQEVEWAALLVSVVRPDRAKIEESQDIEPAPMPAKPKNKRAAAGKKRRSK